ncbi:MAG: cytochrome c maturation protein CcmE [Acidobacteriota bacterium]|nr:cytochrome c maturation protein CcmE [Acidobacteriota bacterium]
MNKYGKFAILMAIIVGSLSFLAYSGIQGSTTYYKTIPELRQMGNTAQTRHVRVGGDVQGNSIVHEAGLVKFNLVQDKQILPVAYEGRDPLPDTFRDGAQALADGRLGPDGVFHASEIQAKCASKYAPKPGVAPDQLQPGLRKPAVVSSPMRSSL